jgi:hypothetical protein
MFRMDSLADKTTLNSKKKWFYAAFIVINLFLSCYYLDVWLSPNAASRAMPVLTLYEDKTIVIDKYKDYAGDVSVIDSHYYSNKAPLSSFIVYPFYSLYKSLHLPELKDTVLKKYPIYIWAYTAPDGIDHTPDGRVFLLPKSATVLMLGDILCGIIPFIIALLLSLMAIKRTNTKVSPVVIVMLSFYASFLFAYAGTYTGHLLSGIFALTGYIFLKKKSYLVSGLMVGLALATEFPVGILVPVWALLIYLNEKKFSKPFLFAVGLIPGFIIVLWYNYHLTGSILKTPYNFEVHQQKQNTQDIGFNMPTLAAFWGLVFSTFRGVLYYTPILILMLWYAIKFGYQNSFKSVRNKMTLVNTGIKNYLLMTIVAYLILYSSYYQWPGGWAFGPRYLIPMVMIALYEGTIYISQKPISAYLLYALTGAGLLFVWMDKSTKIYMFPDDPTHFGNPVSSVIIPDFMKHHFNTNTLPVFLFDSSPVAAIYAWPVLFIAGIIFLALWYSKLFPAPIEIPVVKQKQPIKKANKK